MLFKIRCALKSYLAELTGYRPERPDTLGANTGASHLQSLLGPYSEFRVSLDNLDTKNKK